MLLRLTLIAIGGALGAVLRYLIAGAVQRFGGGSFPVGTLTVNVLGCLLIGVVSGIFAGPYLVREEYRAFILVGLLGAFTTFSTFGFETVALANDREYLYAAANVGMSNVLGLAAVWFGYRLAESWHGA